MKNQFKFLSAVVALALAGQVSAATTYTTWTVGTTKAGTTSESQSVVSGLNAGNVNSGVTSTSTGWADTGAGTPRVIEQQTVSSYPGLGIKNLDACGTAPCDTAELDQPEHALDNNERYEMVMLKFSSAVQLSKMQMSYANTDSDMTVMAYTGGGTPASLAGKTWTAGSLTGWSVIGNYADVGTSLKTINAGQTFSSYWLIGAYNPLGGAVASGFTDQNDHIKLSSVIGCVQGTTDCNPPGGKVPEPGSMALLGIGLLGLIRMRKMRQV